MTMTKKHLKQLRKQTIRIMSATGSVMYHVIYVKEHMPLAWFEEWNNAD